MLANDTDIDGGPRVVESAGEAARAPRRASVARSATRPTTTRRRRHLHVHRLDGEGGIDTATHRSPSRRSTTPRSRTTTTSACRHGGHVDATRSPTTSTSTGTAHDRRQDQPREGHGRHHRRRNGLTYDPFTTRRAGQLHLHDHGRHRRHGDGDRQRWRQRRAQRRQRPSKSVPQGAGATPRRPRQRPDADGNTLTITARTTARTARSRSTAAGLA